MGGYGSYLGFQIRLSKDAEEKAMAKNLHPKLLTGMFFFFVLGATGGITAMLTSDKPVLESCSENTVLFDRIQSTCCFRLDGAFFVDCSNNFTCSV